MAKADKRKDIKAPSGRDILKEMDESGKYGVQGPSKSRNKPAPKK